VKIGCDLQQMASDINKFAIHKRINRCILMGMSMGGAVALQFAIGYPEKIKSLILVSPGPGTVFSKGFFILSPILSFISQKKFFLKLLLKSALMKPLPRDIITEFVDDAVLVSKETWLQYLHPNNSIQNINMLKNFSSPSLIIIGEKDKANNIKFQENIAYTIPKAVKVVLSNEGHAVAIENPNKVLSEIRSFLKG
jgi:pimeloyl-ACP methyl ester carboxylesterase